MNALLPERARHHQARAEIRFAGPLKQPPSSLESFSAQKRRRVDQLCRAIFEILRAENDEFPLAALFHTPLFRERSANLYISHLVSGAGGIALVCRWYADVFELVPDPDGDGKLGSNRVRLKPGAERCLPAKSSDSIALLETIPDEKLPPQVAVTADSVRDMTQMFRVEVVNTLLANDGLMHGQNLAAEFKLQRWKRDIPIPSFVWALDLFTHNFTLYGGNASWSVELLSSDVSDRAPVQEFAERWAGTGTPDKMFRWNSKLRGRRGGKRDNASDPLPRNVACRPAHRERQYVAPIQASGKDGQTAADEFSSRKRAASQIASAAADAAKKRRSKQSPELLQKDDPQNEQAGGVFDVLVSTGLPESAAVEYSSAFEENGFDSAAALQLLTVDDLDLLGVTKLGHRELLLRQSS